MNKQLFRILAALVSFLIVFTVDQFYVLSNVFGGDYGFLFPFLLYGIIYLIIGYDVLWKAVRNLGRGQIFDENFLMTIATFGAFGLAIYRGINHMPIEGFDEACAVLLFYQIGEWFQKYATGKSRQSIAKLMDIRPDYANRLKENNLETVDPSIIEINDIIVVNPGEKIPLDGVVVEGSTDLDMKGLTGEAMPQHATIGNEVISGCVNLTSQIKIRVTKVFYDSTVAKILDLVENAAIKKSKSENFITKFARCYTPVVVSGAILLMLLGGIITTNWDLWLYRALSFLVVSCPCALIISIPLTFFVALGKASSYGILIKGSNYFEKLNQAKIFVFDKTGTLTKGNFAITQVIPENRRNEILRLAAIAEANSHHPIAQSISAANKQPITKGYILTDVSGKGIIAQCKQDVILCGNEKLLKEKQIAFTPLVDTAGTIVYVAHNGKYQGAIIIEDQIRSESYDVISYLAKKHCTSVMLTGDQTQTARKVAEKIGLSTYHASLLPNDKVSMVEQMIGEKKQKEALCFVGDGINDAPVLVRADVGVAMGGVGSDAALEAADVVLMQDNLNGIATAKQLARRTMKIVKENIFLIIFLKFLVLVLSAIGLANMWLAIFGDVGVTILAIFNALRINFFKPLKKRVN